MTVVAIENTLIYLRIRIGEMRALNLILNLHFLNKIYCLQVVEMHNKLKPSASKLIELALIELLILQCHNISA
jgi:hypothetical protein